MSNRLVPAAWLLSLLSLTAGALLPLAFAPFSYWPFSIACPALLLWCWQHGSRAQVIWRGWLFGLGMFGVGTSWVYVSIHTYGAAPVPLAIVLTTLFCAGLALLTLLQGLAFAQLRRHDRSDALLLFPALWVFIEWVRSWLLTGFPWLYLGTPHVDTLLGGWAPFLGVLAISGLTCVCAGALTDALQHRRQAWQNVLLVLSIVVAGLALSHVRWVTPHEPVSTALVQGNIPQQLKWDPEHRDTTLQHYAQLTEPYWGTELIVWPEAALPLFLDEADEWLAVREARARATGSTLITGIPSRHRDAHNLYFYNSIVAIGYGLGSYHKQKLVPFGEFVPFESLLRGLIRFFDLPMSAFSPGPRYQPPLQAGGWAIAPLICYEIAYPDFTARQAQPANIIVTISNDTWFGTSIGPHQHLEMARLRALETGRPVVRATNNGITALIDHHGTITAQLPSFQSGVLTGTVRPTTGQTLFDVWGSWPVVILCVLLLARRRDQ
ncbi:MAG TPA: apolipoprotein N-acyltransferase [Pseudomonadales bacterium]